MTVGQRILQKRKELGLSQEALGEQLGVSRQAIYKWESDATLPEIEKLVSLSRIFSVTVGWLLGVEEDSAAPESGELNEAQLSMVREIVDGYLAAQPAPEPPKKRSVWLKILSVAAAIAIVIAIFNLFSQLDTIQHNYVNLQSSMNSVQSTVNSQIGSITKRVEEILKSQNELTADWGSEIAGINYGENTVTFSVYAVPKVFEEGMTAKFIAHSDGEAFEAEAKLSDSDPRTFAAEVTCTLTDEISLSVVFNTGGDRFETQYLQDWGWLYSESMPRVYVFSHLWVEESNGQIPVGSWVTVDDFGDDSELAEPIKEVRVGLFKDKELVLWYNSATRDVINGNTGKTEEEPGYLLPERVTLDESGVYCVAALVETVSGRQIVCADTPIQYRDGDWTFANDYTISSEPSDWIY